jgi:hypothetical protein
MAKPIPFYQHSPSRISAEILTEILPPAKNPSGVSILGHVSKDRIEFNPLATLNLLLSTLYHYFFLSPSSFQDIFYPPYSLNASPIK